MDITALLTALSASTDKGFANAVNSEDGAAFAQVLATTAGETDGVSAELLSDILPAPLQQKFTALTPNSLMSSAAQETDVETVAQEVSSDETLASALAAAFAVSANAAPAANTDSTAPATDTGNTLSATLQVPATTTTASDLQAGQHPAAGAATRELSAQIPSPSVQPETAATMVATDAGAQITKASPVKVSVDTVQERPVSAVLTSSESAVSGLTSAADSGHAAQPIAAANAPATAQPGAASAPLTLQSPLASDAWGRELEQQLVGIAQRGEKTVELQLNPRELGPLSVNLTLDDQGAKVHFLAAHAAVRTAVEQAIPQLRDSLAQQGIALGEATVGEQQQQSPERSYQDGNFSSGESAPEIASAPADIKVPTSHTGGVDLYA